MHVRDGRNEADRLDAGGVGEARGALDDRERTDRATVDAKEVERLVRASHVRCGRERERGRLHLDDDREELQRIRLHPREQRG